MHRLQPWLKKLLVPVTIMLIPHTRTGPLNLKMPLAALGMLVVFAGVGGVYTVSLTYHAVDYFVMKRKYHAMTGQLQSVQGTIDSLKQAEAEFRRILSHGSRKQVLDAVVPDKNDGSIDINELKKQIDASMKSVAGIRQYLVQQRDVYRATPLGMPVAGRFSSGFGMRVHPTYGSQRFHSGVDLSIPRGTPVHATADGIVSVSSFGAGNGNVVVIEHGHGFSTVYAHNDRNLARVGQTVKRGERIALAGATGTATGVHVHYEVWRQGRPVNPVDFSRESGA
ncbi:MAG: M23 family metallopeptidase [Trichlorobacter sp.]